MADVYASELPQTLEGWYVLYDVYAVNWRGWRQTDASARTRSS